MSKNTHVIDNEILPTSVDKELLYYDGYWHVKVFELNEASIWTDRGTGQASCIQQVDLKLL